MTPSLRALAAPACLLALAACLLALGACSSTPPPSVYTLVPLTPAAPAPAGTLALSVEQVDIPRYLDRPQVVRYGNTYQLEVDDSARWGEPFGAMVSRVLVQDLSRRLPGGQVFLETDVASVPAQLSLEVSVLAFEANPENTIVLDARWVLRRPHDGQILGSQAGTVSVAMRDPTLPGMAQAMSEALAQLSDRIAAGLPPGY